MSNYFELNAGCPREYLPTGGKYFADYTPIVAPLPVGRLKLVQWSDRIWQQDSNGVVSYIKNRIDCADWRDIGLCPVDMKEFFWIKLRCHTL